MNVAHDASAQAYVQSLERALAFLREGERFAIVAHVAPDGDAIASTLAMGWLLRRLGKPYVMYNQDLVPERIGFLPGSEQIVAYGELKKHLLVGTVIPTFDRVIVVDCGDYKRIGEVTELFAPDCQLLNIDHHPSNERYGTHHLLRFDAAATAEIIYELIVHSGTPLDVEVGTSLYTGVLTDTGGFQYASVSAGTFELAAHLTRIGVEGHRISKHLLGTMTRPQLELLRDGLATLQFRGNNRIAYIYVPYDKFVAVGATSEDLEGLVNYARNVEGVEIGILFKQSEEGIIKVSLRSTEAANVSAIAAQFGGGGHFRAAGVRFTGVPAEQVISRVVDACLIALGEN